MMCSSSIKKQYSDSLVKENLCILLEQVEAHAKQSKAKQMPLKDLMTSGNNKAELIQCHTLIVIELTDAYSYPRPRYISASATKCIHMYVHG